MSLMTLLEQAQGGGLFAAVAKSLGLGEAETRNAMARLCPAIAPRMQARAATEEELYQSLLDIIEDGAGASPLEDAESLTGPEAIADGDAILNDVYGSRNEVMVALRQLDAAIPERELSLLAPVSATAVVAALAQANRPLALAASAPRATAGSAAEGFIGALISAIIAGIVAALSRQLKPRSRRRPPSYSRTRTKRKTASARTRNTRRKPASQASAEDLFRDILGRLGK